MTTPFPFVANTVLTAAQLNSVTTLPISAKTASATLVVGDVGYRVQMTSASATTITVNTGIFSQGDTIWISNLGSGTCTITSGTCTVSTASSLALAQYGGGTLVFQSASAATFFSQQSATYGLATGGSSSSITVSGVNYTMLTFTTDSNLVVSRAGLFDCLVVGGGGGAGANAVGSQGIGGGGAGGVVVQTIYLAAATYAIDIGAGGAQYTAGLTTRVISSDLTSLSGVGGGKGGGYSSIIELVGDNGGGGGGGASGIAPRNTAGLGLQGFAGGTGTTTNGNGGGGGGGATAVGAIPVGTAGGNGGAGYDASTFRGEVATTTYYGGGGGGGGASGGTGGVGGGGNRGVAGTANTGGGGGGNTTIAGNNGAAGGAGILLVRFKV